MLIKYLNILSTLSFDTWGGGQKNLSSGFSILATTSAPTSLLGRCLEWEL